MTRLAIVECIQVLGSLERGRCSKPKPRVAAFWRYVNTILICVKHEGRNSTAGIGTAFVDDSEQSDAFKKFTFLFAAHEKQRIVSYYYLWCVLTYTTEQALKSHWLSSFKLERSGYRPRIGNISTTNNKNHRKPQLNP